jgi:hypothetical protein
MSLLRTAFLRATARTIPLVVALVAAVPRPAVAQFGTNLIVNPDAEAGANATCTTAGTVSGWAATGGHRVVAYGTGDYPATTSPGPEQRGCGFFAGGASNALSTLTQSVALHTFDGLAALIDAGRVGFTLAGYLGGFANQDDFVTLSASFRGAADEVLGAATLVGPNAAARGGETGLFAMSTLGVLPSQTRSVQIVLTAQRTAGNANDGYADNLAFTLAERVPTTTTPEPSALALLATGGLAVGGVAARRRRRASGLAA